MSIAPTLNTLAASTSSSGDTFWVYLLFWMLVFGAIGAGIGSSKGQTGTGLILGALLGLLGIIILLFLKPVRRPGDPGYGYVAVPGVGTLIVGWHADPFLRYQLRYYDGYRWTAHVSTNGVMAVDEPAGSSTAPPAIGATPPPPIGAPSTPRPPAGPPTVVSDPIIVTHAQRRWDKAAKQWLVPGPDGTWVPESTQPTQR